MDLSALMALAQGKKSEIAARSNFSNLAKLPMGKSRWRILPGWNAAHPEIFFHDFGQHYIKDKDGNVVVVYVCEQDTFGRPCSICDKVNDLIRSTNDDGTLKLLKEMRSRQIQLVNAVRLDGAEADPKKPVLLGLPSASIMQPYLGLLADYQANYNINILSAIDGRDMTIERSGTGLTTKYSLQPAPANSAAHPEALDRLIDIGAYVEGEFQKGVRKGTVLFENNARALLASGGGAMMLPSGTGKPMRTEPSRVIEQAAWVDTTSTSNVSVSEREVEAALASAPAVTQPKTITQPKTVTATVVKPASVVASQQVVDDSPLNDDELADILKSLE